jgi:hypothetical protein
MEQVALLIQSPLIGEGEGLFFREGLRPSRTPSICPKAPPITSALPFYPGAYYYCHTWATERNWGSRPRRGILQSPSV